jgi:hypothetical protein
MKHTAYLGPAFTFGLALVLSACTSPADKYPKLKLSANPSALVAEEIALKQASIIKGRVAALRDVTAPDGVMFVPQPVSAPAYLKTVPSLPQLEWQVHKVIMSCDGKTGVATGGWSDAAKDKGYFTTVWQRYERADGSGKWLIAMLHNDALTAARKAPDYVETQTASCKGSAPANLIAPPIGVQMKKGLSRDQSLSWTWQYRPDTSRELVVAIWDGEKMVDVLSDAVAAK